MLNQIILVGRLVSDIELNNDEEKATISISVPRTIKNNDGEYENDIISMDIYNSIAKNTAEYCNKGDILGIKGRIKSTDGELSIEVEKITFLSSHNI
jgi:single-strand DNA-binding protein